MLEFSGIGMMGWGESEVNREEGWAKRAITTPYSVQEPCPSRSFLIYTPVASIPRDAPYPRDRTSWLTPRAPRCLFLTMEIIVSLSIHHGWTSVRNILTPLIAKRGH
jgi:hypothetical protein